MQRSLDTAATEAGPWVFDRRSIGEHRSHASDAVDAIEFGRFTLLPRSRRLVADGEPVRLGSRAFAVLMALIEADGTPVSKQDLLSRVWRGAVVEECNLTTQVSALRRALGRDRDLVCTEPGRGYRFSARIRRNTAVAAETDVAALVLQLARIDAKLGEVLALLAADPVHKRIGGGRDEPEDDDFAIRHRTDPCGVSPVS
jgi:DNA-binding winged helix-turn-helix (wHTH) protein